MSKPKVTDPERPAEGIVRKHTARCASKAGQACDCSGGYLVQLWDRRAGRPLRKVLPTIPEAKAWRVEALHALGRGEVRQPTKRTVAEAGRELIAGMKSGDVMQKGGDEYKPSTIRGYERDLQERIGPELGRLKLTDVKRSDVQRLANRLAKQGLSPSSVANMLDPLRAIYRIAMRDEIVGVNPTSGLELRAQKGRRERIAPPEEAAGLLAALPVEQRGVWGAALYAGLRRGELRALRVSDVDLDVGIIRVRRTWDEIEGLQEGGKSAAAVRDVPIFAPLAVILADHLLATDRFGEDLIFGLTAQKPFAPTSVRRMARAAWGWKWQPASKGKPAGWVPSGGPLDPPPLTPIALHESRHTAVSVAQAAGADRASLLSWFGHASVAMTDHYGHSYADRRERSIAAVNAELARAVGTS
jgi:integrase